VRVRADPTIETSVKGWRQLKLTAASCDDALPRLEKSGLSPSAIPPEWFLSKLSEDTPGARILVELCARSKASRREISELSYLDEMEHLFRDIPHPDVRDLLRYRFDEDEESGLEGLALGGGDYSPGSYFPDYAD
jgi:hypothetical protein